MTVGAADLREQLLSVHDVGIVLIARHRRFERFQVEHHIADRGRPHFRIGDVVTAELPGCRIMQIRCKKVSGYAHVVQICSGGLMEQIYGFGLPAESSDVFAILGDMGFFGHEEVRRIDVVDPAADAVCIGVLGVGQVQQNRVGHRLQKSDPRHDGSAPGGNAGGISGEHFRRIAGDRAILKLGTSLIHHIIKCAIGHLFAESDKIRGRMSFAIGVVTACAGRHIEYGTETCLRREILAKSLVSGGEGGALGKGQSLYRTIKQQVRIGLLREESVASKTGNNKYEGGNGNDPLHGCFSVP